MTVYYARNSSGQNFGCYLDVWNLQVTSDRLNVGVSGGHHSYAGSWYFTTYASLSYYENSGHDWENGNYSVSGSGDKQFFSATDYFWRREYDRSINLYCYTEATVNGQYGTANANVWVTVPHLPNAPTNLQATYVSDNRIELSWTAPTRGYEAMCLEVSIDGGSWSEFSVLWNSSTSTSYNQSSADHSYSFRARAYYKNAYSSYTAATSEIKTTPAMPKSISTAAVQGTTVTVNVVNGSSVATKLQYEVSTNGGQTWGATQDSASLTSFDVSISGTGRVRVRNYNSTGVSGWLESEDVTTICPPGPPTLTAPSSNVLNLSDGSVTFSWLHNSIDGSAQTAAKLRYSTDDGSTWTTVNMNPKTDNSYTIDPIPWSTGTTVKWQMQTKGADVSYSDWSAASSFSVYTAPQVNITSPSSTITSMPVIVSAKYSDMDGFTCQAATMSLMKNGQQIYSEAAVIEISETETTITSVLDVAEFLPMNGESYTVVISARSSSTLQASSNATFSVNFTEPKYGDLQVTNDSETGYVSLLASFDNSVLHGKNLLEPKLYTGISYNPTVGTTVAPVESPEQLTAGADGTFTISTTATWKQYSFVVPCSEDDELYQSVKFSTTGTAFGTTWGYLDADKKVLSKYNETTMPQTFSGVLNPDEGAAFYYLLFTNRGGATSTITIEKPMIAAGTTGQPYEPYVEYVEAESISVSRINADGTQTSLIIDGDSGSGFVDRFAPLNTLYQYAVTTKAQSKAVNTVYISNKLSTKYFFVYWGNNIASAMWNPENAGISTTTPTKTRVYYPGRRDPVSYSTDAVSETSQPSWMFLDKAEVGQFRKLMWDGGRGIYKSVDGDVFHADFELTENPAYTEYAYYGTASLSVIRIAGEQL